MDVGVLCSTPRGPQSNDWEHRSVTHASEGLGEEHGRSLGSHVFSCYEVLGCLLSCGIARTEPCACLCLTSKLL